MNPPAADATVHLLLRSARLELETGRDAKETILQVVAPAPTPDDERSVRGELEAAPARMPRPEP